MKQALAYVAPSETAKLMDCITCHGSRVAVEMVRVVSADGVEQKAPAPCARCEGVGKLWQDEREKIVHPNWSWKEQVVEKTAIVALSPACFLFMYALIETSLLHLFASVTLSVVIAVAFFWVARNREKRVQKTREVFYAKTGDTVEMKGKLMQQ